MRQEHRPSRMGGMSPVPKKAGFKAGNPRLPARPSFSRSLPSRRARDRLSQKVTESKPFLFCREECKHNRTQEWGYKSGKGHRQCQALDCEPVMRDGGERLKGNETRGGVRNTREPAPSRRLAVRQLGAPSCCPASGGLWHDLAPAVGVMP